MTLRRGLGFLEGKGESLPLQYLYYAELAIRRGSHSMHPSKNTDCEREIFYVLESFLKWIVYTNFLDKSNYEGRRYYKR